MKDFNRELEKYAQLAIKVAVNIQPGQTLVISSPIVAADFVRKLTKEAYLAGAKNVHIEWSDEEITLTKFLNAPEESFREFPMWKAKGFEEMAEDGAAFLSISASNPDLLKSVDPQRISIANKTSALAMQGYRRYTQSGRVSWAVLSVPTKEWAAKVFPGLDEESQVTKLWENIFKVTRVDQDDPIKAWEDHIKNLNRRLDYLNSKRFKKLFYNSPGTDLIVELPPTHLWVGGGLTNAKGSYFIPNIPTEEVFTLPTKTGVNGTVTSTKPLNYSGNLIEDFSLTFKDGKIVEFTAQKGYETLKKLIETDSGSNYLGEVALVPHHSPVSDSGVIFYNTLFDENASSHFAIGTAYPICIKGGTEMTKEELENNGVNVSLTHVDFMIGSEHMSIQGETDDGSIESIFINGNWVV